VLPFVLRGSRWSGTSWRSPSGTLWDRSTRRGARSVLGERQKVEIIKLLMARSEFLIFDEPTSVLAPHEIDELMQVFRQLRQDGLAVLFITHKLREVIAVADRITVLRRGAVVASMPALAPPRPAW